MKAAVVIGANYGDEGKGLVTDYLAANDDLRTLVIRFNGGAQAGHTVQTVDGLRHVFSHFASGTFAGAQTYLSEFFIANPILFVKELTKLQSHNYSPQATIHPDASVTTPYDMILNQLFENFHAEKRHGSCGVGINETVTRNLHEPFQLSVKDLFDKKKLKAKLLMIRDQWLPLRVKQLIPRQLSQEECDLFYSHEILTHFLDDIDIFSNNCKLADYSCFKKYEKLIFEGAQGLLLDQGHANFPHVTHSHTGIHNVSTLATLTGITHLDIHYVTRCYLTRHGAGPLVNESPLCPCPYFRDDTNIPHPFQGTLRFAPLNIETLQLEINADLHKLAKTITKNVTLVVTCLDQFDDHITIIQHPKKILTLTKNEFIQYITTNTDFEDYLLSYGPTRHDCQREVTYG